MIKVCDALNEADLKFKDGGQWHVSKFNSIYELISYHVVYDVGIYNYLIAKGIINDGKCPITGGKTTGEYAYRFFGRSIEMTKAGLEIARREDPDHDEELQKKIRAAKKQVRNQSGGGGCMGVLVILAILVLVVYLLA